MATKVTRKKFTVKKLNWDLVPTLHLLHIYMGQKIVKG